MIDAHQFSAQEKLLLVPHRVEVMEMTPGRETSSIRHPLRHGLYAPITTFA